MKRSVLLISASLVLSTESSAVIPRHLELVPVYGYYNFNVPATLCLDGICPSIDYFYRIHSSVAEVSFNGIVFLGWSKPCLVDWNCGGRLATTAMALKRAVAARFPDVKYGSILDLNKVEIIHSYHLSGRDALREKIPLLSGAAFY